MKTGRPSGYSEGLADVLLERLSLGESLKGICADEGMPSQSMVFRWLADPKRANFRERYARAREVQADSLFDEILEIADDGSNDWMERKNPDDQSLGWRENGEALRRSHLRVEARKWMAGKLQPKKYGDKVTQEHLGKVELIQTIERRIVGKAQS